MYYLMFSQGHLAFSFNFSDKIINFISHLIFFIFLVFSVSCYYLYYAAYKKLAKYFFDNTFVSTDGIATLVIGSSLRQLVLSAIHNFLRYDYKLQLLSLAITETVYIIVLLAASNLKRHYKKLRIVWIAIFFAFFRVIFNICLYFQQSFN